MALPNNLSPFRAPEKPPAGTMNSNGHARTGELAPEMPDAAGKAGYIAEYLLQKAKRRGQKLVYFFTNVMYVCIGLEI